MLKDESPLNNPADRINVLNCDTEQQIGLDSTSQHDLTELKTVEQAEHENFYVVKKKKRKAKSIKWRNIQRFRRENATGKYMSAEEILFIFRLYKQGVNRTFHA